MQNQTSTIDYYNQNNLVLKNNVKSTNEKNITFSNNCAYCLVKTVLNNFYKCKILYQTPKTICVNWFNGKRYFSCKTMTSNSLTIVRFLND